MSDSAPDRYHYRDPKMDALLDDVPPYCWRCGDASLEGDDLELHIANCNGAGPHPSELPEEGLPTLRRESDVVLRRRAVDRPLWRRALRTIRATVQPGFKICENCPSFWPDAPVLLGDHVVELWLVERADGSPTMIPAREVKVWTEGKVHGPLRQAGWCSQHGRGVMPDGTCERWRA